MNHSINKSDCPSIEELAVLIDGNATTDLELVRHVDTCSDCQTRLDHLTDPDRLKHYGEVARAKSAEQPFLGPPTKAGDLGSFGGFSIESQVGAGGMGIVYRVRDEQLRRTVALKVLTCMASPSALARFERETHAASKLNHPNIVPIYSAGQSDDGRPYLVMPLIEGESLKASIQDRSIPFDETAATIKQIADALQTAHQASLIHRDVKPANILLDQVDGKAKLVDFGLVRGIDDQTLTRTEMMCGTPEYMSPEQANTETSDARCDVYSLGITLYECLTGSVPFRGKPLDILAQHRDLEPVPPGRMNKSVPRDLETICLKAIEKEPGRRYLIAADFANDLQSYIDGKPIQARPTSVVEKTWRWAKRNRSLAALTVALFGMLLIIAGGSSFAAWRLSLANEKATTAEELALNDRSAAIDSLATLVDSLYDELSNDAATIKTREKVVTAAIEGLQAITEVADDRKADQTTFRAYLRIGDLLSLRGASQKAEENYDKAIELSRTLVSLRPDDARAKRDLAGALSHLAVHHFRLGHLEKASGLSEESLTLIKQVLSSDPNDMKALARLVIQYGHELDIIRAETPHDAARVIEYGKSVLPDVERLFERPNSGSKECEAAHTIHFCIGRAYLESNNPPKANEQFTAARFYLDQVLEQTPMQAKLRSTSAVLDRSHAMVKGSLGQLDDAINLFEKALKTLTELSVADPDDRELKQNVANTQSLMSTSFELSGRHEEAIGLLDDAIANYLDLRDHSLEDDDTRILIAEARFKLTASQLSLNRWAEANDTYVQILTELNDHDFSEASAAAVQFYRTHTEVAQEAMARLLGELTDAETPTGECIALMFAARKDAQTSTSELLSAESMALISDINPDFDGKTFAELFTHIHSLKGVFPFYGIHRKSFEAQVHGFVARNYAESELPEASQLSSESLQRSLSAIKEIAASQPGFRELILSNPGLVWVRNTPEFESVWEEIVTPDK